MKLRLSYRVPHELENNTYAAVFSRLLNEPFYDKLQKLELILCVRASTARSIQNTPKNWILSNIGISQPGNAHTSRNGAERPPYAVAFANLSKENQEFLGRQVISVAEINELVRKLARPLLNLQEASILVDSIANPLEDNASAFLARSSSYYFPLTLASHLRELHVETAEQSIVEQPRSKSSHGGDAALSTSIKFEFPEFPKVNKLTLRKFSPPTAEEFNKILERFPNLEELNIKLFDWGQQYRNRDELEQFYQCEAMTKMKHLRSIRLPWPAYGKHQLAYNNHVELKDLAIGWWKGGAARLGYVQFTGSRYDEKSQRRICEKIQIYPVQGIHASSLSPRSGATTPDHCCVLSDIWDRAIC
ncbi:hypothetical protein ABW20_dc0101960 [Dactylellina cionopaga]|nr:hypothetical protein ABW20_dc0101960 [Dactylellina cionopaga]